MEMEGVARLAASRQRVWDALNDADILRASIPGCESLEKLSDTRFNATVISAVGPIKARFGGAVTLTDVRPPVSYTLTGEGQGGVAGFAKADIRVSLEALEEHSTLLTYGVNANVGGKLAQLGSRMIAAAARKSADDFFARFAAEVSRVDGMAPAPATTGPLPREVTIAQPGEPLKVWIADGIAEITLDRPERRNAMTSTMWKAFPSIMAGLQADPQVRVIMLTGAGEDFCTGADISEFETVRANVGQATQYEIAVDACCDAIAQVSKPTIAVIRGYCLGGGAHLAMSCDFRYASPRAVFGIPAARLSIIYGVSGTRKLLSLVGLARAKHILFGAQRFDAAQALRIGFVDFLAGSGQTAAPARKRRWFGWGRAAGDATRSATVDADPMVDARAFARALAGNAPLSIAGAKALLNGLAMGTGALDVGHADALIAAAIASDDYREGRTAFVEKRVPDFKGR